MTYASLATDASSHSDSGVIQPKKVKGIGFGVDILGGGAVNLRQTKGTPAAKGEERKTTIEFLSKDGSAMKPSKSVGKGAEEDYL